MKQANHNEVDLLLRALARGREESSLLRSPGDGILADHLDADELNSYAEGVLPAATRLRYSEHLADCDACRGIVVSLAQAGGASRDEVLQPQSFGFWRKLGAVFSAPVLRYALPVLVLTVVIGIGLLSLRQSREPRLIAQNEPASQASKPLPETAESLPSAAGTLSAPSTKPKVLPSPALSDSYLAKTERPAEKDGSAPTATATGTGRADALAPLSAKDAAKAGDVGGVSELRPSYSSEPTAPPAAPAAMKRAADSQARANEEAASRTAQERQRDETFRVQQSDEHGPNRSVTPGNTAGVYSARRLGGPTNNNRIAENEDKKSKSPAAETRTVAGREFAREGNTWVDTAYNASRTTIRVARGSEQFRALVADEPGLRAIAQQLNGVVIVVWKTQAYRIQ
jgi:hypothetical protein